jgi:hypothetical protein
MVPRKILPDRVFGSLAGGHIAAGGLNHSISRVH